MMQETVDVDYGIGVEGSRSERSCFAYTWNVVVVRFQFCQVKYITWEDGFFFDKG